jgi:hypothetical protein
MAPDAGPDTREAAAAPKPVKSAKEEAERIALVKRAKEILGAAVTRVDEGFGEGA